MARQSDHPQQSRHTDTNLHNSLFRLVSSGKRNDDESAKEKLYTYALPVLGITDFRGLQNETIADDA